MKVPASDRPARLLRGGASAPKRSAAAPLAALAALVLAACSADAEAVSGRDLRVCADPNNLPYSNQREEGFENELARLLARELDVELSYTWWPQRRGFIRNTLGADLCDVVMGIPSSMELALATTPYYRSMYVFLTREDRDLEIESLDDPRLRGLRIGLHLIGDDYNNSPAAAALARRGFLDNLVGYSIYGNYAEENPPARLVDAVVTGEVDLAIVWGPIAGYFGKRQPVGLELTPVTPQIDLPFVPFVYDISLGVERADTAMKQQLDAVLLRRRDEIQGILERYDVPLLAESVRRSSEDAI